MKRFLSVLAFLLLVGTSFFVVRQYMTEQKKIEQAQLVERDTIQVYTDVPKGLLESIVPIFTEKTGLYPEIHYMTASEWAHFSQGADNPADVVITSQATLQWAKKKGWLLDYTSEQTDTALEMFRDSGGAWSGLWIEPFVFAVNDRFVKESGPVTYSWESVLTDPRIRITMTDVTMATMAGDFLVMFTEHYGEEMAFQILGMGHHQMVQYGRYLSTPSHMAAMGKCDIGISGWNEAVKTKQEGLPLHVFYPIDGTPWYLYGVALVDNGRDTTKSELFLNWLLVPSTYKKFMEDNGFHYFHVNEVKVNPDEGGTELLYWPLEKNYNEEGKDRLVNRWIADIRFGKEEQT